MAEYLFWGLAIAYCFFSKQCAIIVLLQILWLKNNYAMDSGTTQNTKVFYDSNKLDFGLWGVVYIDFSIIRA